MMSRKRQKNLVHQEDVLKIIDHGLSVEVVHGNHQEVPIDTQLAPMNTFIKRPSLHSSESGSRDLLKGSRDVPVE
jgi:hypothetical protein